MGSRSPLGSIPYSVGEDQQIIAAKNRYSLDQRQWGVMVDRDGRFRLYLWQDKWVTVDATTPPNPGRWYMIGVVVRPGEAELWVNGKRAGKVLLSKPIPKTDAPLTLGGVDDNGHIRQTLFGAIDEAQALRPRPCRPKKWRHATRQSHALMRSRSVHNLLFFGKKGASCRVLPRSRSSKASNFTSSRSGNPT